MCVLLSIYQKKTDPEINENLTSTLIEFSMANPDGVGILAYNLKKEKIYHYRDFEIKKSDLKNLLNSYEVIHLHFRLATTGIVNEKNIHFWKKQNWYLAHNGAIHEFRQSTKDADSLILFKSLLKKKLLSDKGILLKPFLDYVKNLSFWGRFALVNSLTKKAFYYGDFKAYDIENKVLIISSTDINLGVDKMLFGIPFKQRPTTLILKRELEGFFMIDPKEARAEMYDSSTDYDDYTGRDYSCEMEKYDRELITEKEYNRKYGYSPSGRNLSSNY